VDYRSRQSRQHTKRRRQHCHHGRNKFDVVVNVVVIIVFNIVNVDKVVNAFIVVNVVKVVVNVVVALDSCSNSAEIKLFPSLNVLGHDLKLTFAAATFKTRLRWSLDQNRS
jgi:hypothetical protein